MKIVTTSEFDPATRVLTITRCVELRGEHIALLHEIRDLGCMELRGNYPARLECLLDDLCRAKLIRRDALAWYTTYVLTPIAKEVFDGASKDPQEDRESPSSR